MIHSRETSPPTLIQPRPTRAASPPHATGLHGVGSLREGLSTTTPQPSTPSRTSSGLYWRQGCHQSLASQHMASPDHCVKAGRRRHNSKRRKGGTSYGPPRNQDVKNRVSPRSGATGYSFINGHWRPGCPRAQPPNDDIQQKVPRSSGSATPAPKEISHAY